jgi:hypothetical protein
MQVTEFYTPYVGPRPFQREDQDRFFGRDRETQEIVSQIYGHPLLLIYAQSGAGKTSLLNAQIAPRLEQEGHQVLPLARVGGALPADFDPRTVENPYLSNALLWLEPEADPQALSGLSLRAYLEGRPRAAPAIGLRPMRVLVFDQFEELFTHYPVQGVNRRVDFFRQIVDALDADPLLRCVFVMREEYVAHLDPFVRLLPEELRIRFRLERLRAEAARAAVKGPLAGTGRAFAEGVAEALVEELLQTRVETPGGQTVDVVGEFVEPVQLQVACRSLWDALPPDVTLITQDHLQAFADVDYALAEFYESGLQTAAYETGVSEGALRTWFEEALITPVGTRGIVFRGVEETGGLPNAAVDVLEQRYLIRGELRAGARWYELTHDRFIEPIRASNRQWQAARHL